MPKTLGLSAECVLRSFLVRPATSLEYIPTKNMIVVAGYFPNRGHFGISIFMVYKSKPIKEKVLRLNYDLEYINSFDLHYIAELNYLLGVVGYDLVIFNPNAGFKILKKINHTKKIVNCFFSKGTNELIILYPTEFKTIDIFTLQDKQTFFLAGMFSTIQEKNPHTKTDLYVPEKNWLVLSMTFQGSGQILIIDLLSKTTIYNVILSVDHTSLISYRLKPFRFVAVHQKKIDGTKSKWVDLCEWCFEEGLEAARSAIRISPLVLTRKESLGGVTTADMDFKISQIDIRNALFIVLVLKRTDASDTYYFVSRETMRIANKVIGLSLGIRGYLESLKKFWSTDRQNRVFLIPEARYLKNTVGSQDETFQDEFKKLQNFFLADMYS